MLVSNIGVFLYGAPSIASVRPKKKVTEIVKLAEEIVRRSNEPMSIDQIKGKFQLAFPFRVKKVCSVGNYAETCKDIWPVGIVVTVTGHDKDGCYAILEENVITPGEVKQWVLI